MVKPAIEEHAAAPESEPQEVGMVSQMKEEPVVEQPQVPVEVVSVTDQSSGFVGYL